MTRLTEIPERSLRREFAGYGHKVGSAHETVIPVMQAIARLASCKTERAQGAIARLLKEFAIPTPAASAMSSESSPTISVRSVRAAGVADLAVSVPECGRAVVDAKVEIVLAFRDFHRESHRSLEVAAREFVHLYNDGIIPVSEAARLRKPSISAGRVLCDDRTFRASGAAGFVPHHGNRLNSGVIQTTPEFAEFILAMVSGNPMIRSRQVHSDLVHELIAPAVTLAEGPGSGILSLRSSLLSQKNDY